MKSVEHCEKRVHADMGKRIEICAPIGVGKTTLARELAKHGFHPVYEDVDNNPFLERYYREFSPESSYDKNNWFIDSQTAQFRNMPDDKITVVDYAIALDRAFINVGADTPESIAGFNQRYDDLMEEVGQPDLVIVLKLPLDEQIDRINARGREMESGISREYLENLNEAIEARLTELPENVQIMEVDARRDFRKPHEIQKLVRDIHRTLGTDKGHQL